MVASCGSGSILRRIRLTKTSMLRSNEPALRPCVRSSRLSRDSTRPGRSQKVRSRSNSALVIATRAPAGLRSSRSLKSIRQPRKVSAVAPLMALTVCAAACRRSTALMRASNSRGLNGFARESAAPISSPRMRSTSSPRAVSMMIGVWDSARNLRHRLRPSSPGNITSRMTRSTRESASARAISRPSFAVVTLQELVRKYFAINVRVSRSSSTTRIFGGAGWGMTVTLSLDSRRSAKYFYFQIFPETPLQHRATWRLGDNKALLRLLTIPSAVLGANPGRHMTSISAAYSNTLTPLQQLQDQLQAEVNSGAISSSDQGALSSALNDINSSLQSNPAIDPGSATNASPGDLKSKIDTLIANQVA